MADDAAYRSDGSTISIEASGLANYAAGVLTGGTYRVLSAGAPSTLDLGSATIRANAATIHLGGTNSAFAALDELADNIGSLTLSGGRELLTKGELSNTGEIHVLSGGRLSVLGSLTSSATSLITGAGEIRGSSLQLAGTVAPGDGAGMLSLIGNTELFASTRPATSLLAANANIARGRLAQATVDLDRARGLIVGVP